MLVDGVRRYPSSDGVVRVPLNSRLSVSVSSSNRTKSTSYFLKDGDRLQSGGRYTITADDDLAQIQLSVTSVRRSDGGTFVVVFENPGGAATSSFILDIIAGE